jgi:nucleoside-diphosphate-sugar epimerase
MKNLLLIGGTGFLGKSFLDSYRRGLLDKWGVSKILILSRNPEKIKKDAPELMRGNIELHCGDISIIDALPNADYVIHAAASADAQVYLQRPITEKRNIEMAAINYSRVAKTFHAKSKILYVSSGAVYGAQPSTVEFLSEEDGHKYSIESFETGKRDYAIAKRTAEKIIQGLGEQNLKVSIARCFAFVGPWLPRDQHFAIGNFIEDGLKGCTINVKAKTQVYRSYMHSDDLVNWLMSICDSGSEHCPIYNVGSNQAVEIRTVAEMVAKQLNVMIRKKRSNGDKLDRYIPSTDKGKKELGLEITMDLEHAIEKTIHAVRERSKVEYGKRI